VRAQVLEALQARDERVLVVALRDPYELAEMPNVTDYLCAFGQRWCSVEAAAAVLFGEATASGTSPVSVPGTGVRAG